MKKADIHIGRLYEAKVSGKIVTVRVDQTSDLGGGIWNDGRHYTKYDVTNLATGRKLTFRSAARFRRPVTKGE